MNIREMLARAAVTHLTRTGLPPLEPYWVPEAMKQWMLTHPEQTSAQLTRFGIYVEPGDVPALFTQGIVQTL